MAASLQFLNTRESVGLEAGRILQEGDPTIGWEGDPYLSLYRCLITDKWEVWDEYSGEPHLVAAMPASRTPNMVQLCAKLRDGDLRKVTTEDVMKRVDAENKAVKKAVDAAGQDRLNDAAVKVHWALSRADGHLY